MKTIPDNIDVSVDVKNNTLREVNVYFRKAGDFKTSVALGSVEQTTKKLATSEPPYQPDYKANKCPNT